VWDFLFHVEPSPQRNILAAKPMSQPQKEPIRRVQRTALDLKHDTMRQRLALLVQGKNHEWLAGQIFANLLNYAIAVEPLPHQKWNVEVSISVKEACTLNGAGDFKVLYCQIERLTRGVQRSIVHEIIKHNIPSARFLVVFANGSRSQWDFVSPKIQVAKFAPRLRFLPVRRDDRHHTASRILLAIKSSSGMTPGEIQALSDSAFDKEKVTRGFFEDFRETLTAITAEIETQNQILNSVRAEALAHHLLERFLFLYFLQRKGWLDGDLDYLANKYSQFRNESKATTFYSSFLLRLFQKLATAPCKRPDDLGVLPFLNGRLFDFDPGLRDIDTSLWIRLKIRNQIFERLFDKRTGLFEKHNFTVHEDTPLDATLAVDPEMLGCLFENLVLKMEKGEDLRKKTGSYYTPRLIVHFMCKEALSLYLIGRLRSEGTTAKQIANWQKKLSSLSQLNASGGIAPAVQSALETTITKEDARWLRNAVLACRACDPAVGSGAFPVGLLHEIVNLVRLSDARIHGSEFLMRRNYDYELKRQIIEDCLYGVDIQAKAVRICEVRLWLSLVVDYDLGVEIDPANKGELSAALNKIPMLPNLTYLMRCGDGIVENLFGHSLQLKEITRDDEDIISEIRSAKHLYYSEGDLDARRRTELSILKLNCNLAERLIRRKKEAFARIQKVNVGETKKQAVELQRREVELAKCRRVERLAKSAKERVSRLLQRKRVSKHDYFAVRQQFQDNFLWAVDFAEVLGPGKGFSITIANPPYVSFGLRGNKSAHSIWADYVREYYPRSAEYKLSLYAIFIDRGLELCSEAGGVMAFITPDSFLLGRYFSKVRRRMLDSCSLNRVIMFEKDFWEPGVVGRPTITLATRDASRSPFQAFFHSGLDQFARGIGQHYSYSSQYFENVPYNRFRLFFHPLAMDFVKALERKATPLRRFVRIATGVRSKIGQGKIVGSLQKGKTWKKGITSGGQVHPFRVDWKGEYINIDPELLWAGGWDPAIVEHPKLMIRQTGDSIIAGLDNEGLYHLNNVHSLATLKGNVSLGFLSALLNSRLMNRYYHLVSLERGRPMAQTDIETLELLPVRLPDAESCSRIQALMERSERGPLREALENEIALLYQLSPELQQYLKQDALYPTVH
jgi:hypothetical protein